MPETYQVGRIFQSEPGQLPREMLLSPEAWKCGYMPVLLYILDDFGHCIKLSNSRSYLTAWRWHGKQNENPNVHYCEFSILRNGQFEICSK